MGLTNKSVGHGAIDQGLFIKKRNEEDKVIAVAGNPNVGKSTIFNALTGMKQHTGNWPGKTVSNAQGYCKTLSNSYVLVDIPGTYSLMAHSAEEEVARNFICFGNPDATVVVCDATCLERNLNLVLQITEISHKTVVCVNLLDEAKRKNIFVDLNKLSKLLNVPVVGTVAQKKGTLKELKNTLDNIVKQYIKEFIPVKYPKTIEAAIEIVKGAIENVGCGNINPRWLALKLIDGDEALIAEICSYLGKNIIEDEKIFKALKEAETYLENENIKKEEIKDIIITTVVKKAEDIGKAAVSYKKDDYNIADRKADNIITSKKLGYPLMIAMLALVFWITIYAANYPSQLLSNAFSYIGGYLGAALRYINTPYWLSSMLIDGIYKVLTWVISVMLPPMAIFFPFFTLLEDIGYLPRIAFNLDKPFKCCNACGKQALTMCMGFGCNAAGVTGCRIIDSPRERLIAIITNSFVPCNGRFPTLITLITMFFIGSSVGILGTVSAALILTFAIILGIGATFLASKLLSLTLLKGVPSSFTLELPPYRKPQIGKVIIRSVFDRTLFVLGRAVSVAAPAGLIIWLMANITVNGASVLSHCSAFLDPFARLIGLDGVILMAFILGFPANEIVLPLIIMTYLSKGSLAELSSIAEIKELFLANGWTSVTAICTMLFSLFHWPCSTTVLTIKKETESIKWTAVSILLPTAFGIISCFLVTLISKFIV